MAQDYIVRRLRLQENEEIVLILRRHSIAYGKQIALATFLILLDFFLMFFLIGIGILGVAFFLALLLTAVFYGCREFFIWYFNCFIITNARIIYLRQSGFFHKTVSELPLDKITDISYQVKGVWQTILKLGTIKVQAQGASIVLPDIKEVSKVNQLLADLLKEKTGQELEVKEVKDLSPQVKEKITEDFLQQDDLAEYDGYDLQELSDKYVEVFGALRLKKKLADELADFDNKNSAADEKKEEISPEIKFKHRKIK